MKITEKISIKIDFTDSPGARYREDGEKSGEEFLEDILEPKFSEAVEDGCAIVVDLDGVMGYPSSFVSGSFGKLSLKYGASTVLNHIEFKSDESDTRLEKIKREIISPRKDD